ncbi:MAG: hypothetical protein C0490_06765 [Marivirga sp.]|nr:hypothetical protein [Marivirga sp.]
MVLINTGIVFSSIWLTIIENIRPTKEYGHTKLDKPHLQKAGTLANYPGQDAAKYRIQKALKISPISDVEV